MKKRYFGLILLGFVLFTTFTQAQNNSSTAVQTVTTVDLKRYSGKWFEIARYPNKFQKQCVGNTIATYTQKANGRIEVLNECLTKNGTVDKATGEAKIIDKTTNAKLEVRFAPSIFSFISSVWGDYWIIDLDENYNYAVIGDPKREYFWILSRNAEMSDAIYQNILRRAEKQGFNPAKVVKTPQNVEAVKGAVIQKQ
ncbi:lipocalin family protein [soil metagenome]